MPQAKPLPNAKLKILFLCTGNARKVHVPFDGPPRLARSATTEEDALTHYRRVRDEIRAFVEQLAEMPA